MTKINLMALRHSAFYSPFLMTMAGGFLKEEGIDYTYTVATPDNTVPNNLESGTCHVAQSAVATRLMDLEHGIDNDIVHFAQINNRDGFFLASRKPIKSFDWGMLSGKSVLVDHFFQPHAMFKYALHKKGVDIRTVEFIDAGDVDAIDKAFRSGRGDFVHQQGPAPQQMALDGVGHVVAAIGEAVGPVAFSSLCATREWCDSDMAGAFLRAYRNSMAYVTNTSADDIARQEIAAGFFPNIDPSVLAATIADYQSLGCWELDTTISQVSFENLQDVFLYNELISHRYNYNDVVTTIGKKF